MKEKELTFTDRLQRARAPLLLIVFPPALALLRIDRNDFGIFRVSSSGLIGRKERKQASFRRFEGEISICSKSIERIQ